MAKTGKRPAKEAPPSSKAEKETSASVEVSRGPERNPR